MKSLQIPSGIALVVGIVMAICGQRLALHQHDVANQTTGEFIIPVLTVGGVLIAIIAGFGLGRSSRK